VSEYNCSQYFLEVFEGAKITHYVRKNTVPTSKSDGPTNNYLTVKFYNLKLYNLYNTM